MVERALLESIDRHINEIRVLILKQHQLVARLVEAGKEARSARHALTLLESAYGMAQDYRTHLSKQLTRGALFGSGARLTLDDK